MLWSGIRSIANVKTKSQLSQISHLLESGKQVDEPVKMANMSNNYFVNVGAKIDKSIPRARKSPQWTVFLIGFPILLFINKIAQKRPSPKRGEKCILLRF